MSTLKTRKKEEIGKDTREWKYFPFSWIKKINFVKMAIPLRTIYKFNTILIKT